MPSHEGFQIVFSVETRSYFVTSEVRSKFQADTNFMKLCHTSVTRSFRG